MTLFNYHKGYNKDGDVETTVEVGWLGLAIIGILFVELFLR